jgi:hypothetical protein
MYDMEKWIDIAVDLGVWKGPAVEREGQPSRAKNEQQK